jgi:hypothetical protein
LPCRQITAFPVKIHSHDSNFPVFGAILTIIAVAEGERITVLIIRYYYRILLKKLQAKIEFANIK